jgi:uncharacterized protein (TIGR02996 family)
VSEREAFLKAIAAVPDDDTARLAFADWLDEHGDPDRAEFVRLQIRRARFGGKPCARETELFAAHRDTWLGPLFDDRQVAFRRGFAEAAELHACHFVEFAGELSELCPALTELDVIGARGRGEEIAEALPRSVRTLRVEDWPHPDDARALAASSRLSHLERLSVWIGTDSDGEMLQHFAKLPALKSVELVQLYGGFQAGERAAELDAHADALAAGFNAMRGAQVARVWRPFDGPFPLAAYVGYGLVAGELPDETQIFVSCAPICEVLRFDATGTLQSGELIDFIGDLSGPSTQYSDYHTTEIEALLRERIGFVPGRIVVREFAGNVVLPSSDLAVYKFGTPVDFPSNALDEPNSDAREDELDHIRYFLRSSNFCIGYGNECWADDSGQIHTT